MLKGQAYTTYFRGLDPRIGRWLQPDPVFQPWQSPYTSMDCNPVKYIDTKGNISGNGNGDGNGKSSKNSTGSGNGDNNLDDLASERSNTNNVIDLTFNIGLPTPSGIDGHSGADDWSPLKRKVVIDPGHGGIDSGTPKRKGQYHESEIVLDVSEYVYEALKEMFETYMTRDDDDYVSMDDRVKLTDDLGADLFISIHVDASDNTNADHLTIYVHPESNDLAKDLASSLKNSLSAVASTKNGVFIKEANWKVLRENDKEVGDVLIEIGFITNERQETLFQTDAYKQKIGWAIASGIFSTYYTIVTD